MFECHVCMCYMDVILNVNIKVWIKKRRKKTNNPSSSRWWKERSPAAIHICIYSYKRINVYVYCNIRYTSMYRGQFVMKSKRSFNAFSTLLLLHLNHSCLFSKPFYVLFFDTRVFYPVAEYKKKLSQAKSTHS